MFECFKDKKQEPKIEPSKIKYKVENKYENIKLYKYDITIKMITGDIFTTVFEDYIYSFKEYSCLVKGFNSAYSPNESLVELSRNHLVNKETDISINTYWTINKINWDGTVSYEAITQVLNSNQICSIEYKKSVLETKEILNQYLMPIE